MHPDKWSYIKNYEEARYIKNKGINSSVRESVDNLLCNLKDEKCKNKIIEIINNIENKEYVQDVSLNVREILLSLEKNGIVRVCCGFNDYKMEEESEVSGHSTRLEELIFRSFLNKKADIIHWYTAPLALVSLGVGRNFYNHFEDKSYFKEIHPRVFIEKILNEICHNFYIESSDEENF